MKGDVVGWDEETHLFGPELITPAVVCGAFSESRSRARTIVLDRDAAFERTRRLIQEQVFVGQRVSYDMACAAYTWPELVPLIFDAYYERRVHDVGIREGLINLSITGQVGYADNPDNLPSLADLAYKYRGLDLSSLKSGEVIWRTNFHELDGVPVADYPQDALEYVQQDAWLAREVFLEQEDPPTEWLHVAASFCYYLKTARGLRVDRKLKRRLQREVERELAPENLPLLYAGKNPLVVAAQPPMPHKKGHKNHKAGCDKKKGCPCPVKLTAPQPERVAKSAALVPLVMRVCTENNIEIPFTEPTEKFPNGQVKTDEVTIAMLSGFDPTLAQYHKRMEKDKLRTSYFPAMEWPIGSGVTARTIHPGFEDLKKTGRGSSRGASKKAIKEGRVHYPSVNIQQADPRIRACYMPRPGWVFAVADFSAIDLVCLAQTVFTLFGKNNLTDHVNSGINLHTFLATAIAYERVPWFRKEIQGKSDLEGYEVFKSFAKAPHKKSLDDPATCSELCRPCFYKAQRDLAKKVGLGFAGGMGIGTFIALVAKELHEKMTPAEAKKLKRIWLRTYPVMRKYLDWAGKQKDGTSENWLAYTSPLGMRRGKCSYTECANGNALQTPAAEGMKIAMFLVTRECYVGGGPLFGCRPVINMHDELVIEIPITTPEEMDARARRLGALMVKGQKVVCPDVKVEAEPLLTTRWVKDAKQVKNDRGLIVPWEWKESS